MTTDWRAVSVGIASGADGRLGIHEWNNDALSVVGYEFEMALKEGAMDIGGWMLFDVGVSTLLTPCIAAYASSNPVRVEAGGDANYPTPARQPAYSVLDNTRLAHVFGISLSIRATARFACLSNPKRHD